MRHYSAKYLLEGSGAIWNDFTRERSETAGGEKGGFCTHEGYNPFMVSKSSIKFTSDALAPWWTLTM